MMSSKVNFLTKFIKNIFVSAPTPSAPTPSAPTRNLSPKWLAEQGYTPEAGLPPSGGYRSGGAKYPYGVSTHAPVMGINHYAIRQQARDAYHDTPQAKAIVDRFADTVVDTGLILESEPLYQILGITPEAAEQWAEDVEMRFDAWARSKQSHRSQNMNLYQAQRLYAIMQQRDNDQFVRLFYDGKGLMSKLQFEIYDPNQIRGDAYTSTYSQFSSSGDGIEKNADGSEKAFKIWYEQLGLIKYETVPSKSENGLTMMLHGFYSEYPGQTRGYSRLGHALQDFEKITDFSQATITNAMNRAMFTMAIENAQADPSDPFEDYMNAPGGAGPASKAFPLNDTAAEENTYSAIPSFTQMPEATMRSPGVTIANLQRGDTIRELGKSGSQDTYGTFVDAFTSYLCASTGMPLEVLLMKFGSNYSASRGTLILFWRIAQIWVNEMAADFLSPLFESWLTCEIAERRVSAPGWTDPRIRAAWLNCRWIGAPMPNIDPQKTANADKAYLEMGATTMDRVARNLNGSSASSNRQKLKREYADLPAPPWDEWGSDIETTKE